MKQIYTRTGDEGMTSLRGGVRVPKDDPHIEANGCLDELNALLGVARALLPADAQEINELLWAVQRELMVVMSHVATPAGQVNPKPLRTEELTLRFEQEIDRLSAEKPAGFILPEGSLFVSQLHLARTVARRAERRLWSLHREAPVNPSIMRFVNRLSDLLFMIAAVRKNSKS